MKQRLLIITGFCIIAIGLSTAFFFMYRQHNDIKPVADQVNNSTSQTTSGNINVGNSTPGNGIQQAGTAGGGSSNTSDTTSDSASEVSQLTNPSTFGQYNTAKYQDANEAFYANLQVGTGVTLSKAGQKAIVSYKGWLTNGTLFDETKVNAKGQSEAFEFTYEASPEQVIPGFDEGLSGMKVGGTRLLIIPPAAGYGPTVHGPIPANSVLIFEISLDGIE